MKNNYNPYTVPENFFEDTSNQAIKRFRNRRHAMQCGAVAMVVAAALIVTPLVIHTHDNKIQETDVASNNLAGMYEYDIFLQVNFTE